MSEPIVLHILPTFDTGGLGSLGLTMIDAWPEPAQHLAIAPRYIHTKSTLMRPYMARCGQGNVWQVDRHVWLKPPAWVSALAKGIAKIQRGRIPQNVIAYNFLDSVWSAQAVRVAGFRGTVAAHVGTVLPDTDATRGTAQSKFAWATKFVPASAAIRGGLTTIGTPPERIHEVTWNGVMLDAYDCRKATVAREPLTFGFSGRMAHPPVKDWELLFEAFAKAQIPGSKLRLAGDGPLMDQLKNMAGRYPGAQVEFVGNLTPEQMIQFLHSVDVFVMAALPFEGFSMALVEAVAAGCYVIGTDVPSVREVFQGLAPFAFLAADAEQLAKVMRAVALDSDTRRLNSDAMIALRTKLGAKRMAREYWAIR